MLLGRGKFSLFLLVCPRIIFDNQRVMKTEKGSDLMIYAAPFFLPFFSADFQSGGMIEPLFHDLQFFDVGLGNFQHEKVQPAPDQRPENLRQIHFRILQG